LAGSLPQFYVGDLVGPPDAEDLSQALVDKRLDLVGDGVSYSPCLGPIQEDCFHIGVKDWLKMRILLRWDRALEFQIGIILTHFVFLF
jgi:hypothetical protein